MNESASISSTADGFSVAVPTPLENAPPIVAVLPTYGLKSILSLNEYSLPDIGDPNIGISAVAILSVAAVLASSIIPE